MARANSDQCHNMKTCEVVNIFYYNVAVTYIRYRCITNVFLSDFLQREMVIFYSG